MGNAEVFGAVVLIGPLTHLIRGNVLAMCQREKFSQRKSGDNHSLVKYDAGLSSEEERPSFHCSISRPMFSASIGSADGNACIFRFLTEGMEAGYRLLHEILSPLEVELGTRPYQDRIHRS